MSNKLTYTARDGAKYKPDSCTPLEAAWNRNEVELETLARGSYPGISLKEKELTQIQSIGFWDAKSAQNWGLEFHRNEGIEICFLESGLLDFNLDNTTYRLLPNVLTITRPWIPHKLGNPNIGPSKLHWFILDVGVRQPHQQWQWPEWIILKDEDLEKLTDILRRNEQPVWQVGPNIRNTFIEIGKLIKQKNRFWESRLKVLINEVLIQLLELFILQKPELNDSLIQSKRSVEIFLKRLSEMLSEDWSLQDMATYCGLGTTQFSKYCRELTNTTPTNYLNQLRLEKAHELIIKKQDLSMTDIAYECGFSSNQYFTQVFKKRYKITPMELRLKEAAIK